MRRRAIAASAAALVSLLSAGPAPAQGVPVFDSSGVAQMLAQLEQMRADYAEQLHQLAELRRQYEMMRQHYDSITGARGISGILNSTTDIAARRAAADFGAILDGAISGSPIAGNVRAIEARLDELRGVFDLASLPELRGSDVAQDRAIATLAGSGMAAMATADETYARANASMERVSDLIGRIDGNEDLKASTDFNTRMLAEVAVLLSENLRLQAAIANSVGSEALHNARDGLSSRRFMKISE